MATNRLSDLQNMLLVLEKCQKSLNDYLDSKRNAFPRFFFISDDELLSILGNSDPICVQVRIFAYTKKYVYLVKYCTQDFTLPEGKLVHLFLFPLSLIFPIFFSFLFLLLCLLP